MAGRKYKTMNKKGNTTKQILLDNWKRYYHNNHEYHLSRNRKYYLKRIFKWYEWLQEVGYSACEKCGFDKHPKAIDFHHRIPEEKLFGIGKFINGRQCNDENKVIVLIELKKCDCLCANCHRIEHFVTK